MALAVKNFEFQQEMLSSAVEGCVNKEEINVIDKQIKKCATKEQLREMKEDISSFVEKTEFAILQHDNAEVKRDLERIMKKDEIITRFNLLNDSIHQKLSERPTITTMKKLLDAFESKIDGIRDQNQYFMDVTEQLVEDQNKELKS